MSASAETEVSRLRHASALLVAGLLLVAGVVMTVRSEAPRDLAEYPQLAVLIVMVPLYIVPYYYTLDYEFRNDAYTVTLVQLPLALGVLLVLPLVHLAARIVAALTYAVVERQNPLKAAYNLGMAAFELGAASLAVSLVGFEAGPALWLALYVGLVAADLVGTLALAAIWRLLGMQVTAGRTVSAFAASAPAALLFTGIAIVAISAFREEHLTVPITLGLVGGLAVAYRAHRRTVSQQQATEQLYEFVKDLGPLDLASDEAALALERIRGLLNTRELGLAIRSGQTWSHLLVNEEGATRRTDDRVRRLSEQVATTGTAALRRGLNGDTDSMATPLVGTGELSGILTANDRMGAARSFDMRDLRLLETMAAELSTALERGQMLAELGRAATTDPLTGMPNLADTIRRLSDLLLDHREVVLAAVAVDSFREVNDTLGHEVGDELLVEVARRLTLASPNAIVGRIGGGRFAVAVPAPLAGGDPEMFGLGIRAQVEGSAQIGAVGTHVRLSVGVVQAPEHGSEAATLIRRAETAMYSARHHNGGPVLWEPAYEVTGTRRLAVVMALREALAGGAIGVAYQPKVETATGKVSGVEALARWTHPALGAIRPDEFVPLAEASGLMGPLTSSVLRQSLTACKGWQRRAEGVGVAVNVSAVTVLDPAFVTEVAAILASVGIAAELLTLELTEGVVVHDPELAVVRMEELRSLGVKLSVDDFGTGYSSLTYLKGLPVDEVKIDKGFIDGLAGDPADRAVVRAVVDIAHTLGLRVVAEGVEQQEQHGILRVLGVDEVQGYLHARPMSSIEVSVWLRSRESVARLRPSGTVPDLHPF